MDAELLAVGVITGTSGVHGELKCKSFSGEPGRFAGVLEGSVSKGDQGKEASNRSRASSAAGTVLKIAGMETPEDARRLVGWEVWLPREHAARLGKGEFYTGTSARARYGSGRS